MGTVDFRGGNWTKLKKKRKLQCKPGEESYRMKKGGKTAASKARKKNEENGSGLTCRLPESRNAEKKHS